MERACPLSLEARNLLGRMLKHNQGVHSLPGLKGGRETSGLPWRRSICLRAAKSLRRRSLILQQSLQRTRTGCYSGPVRAVMSRRRSMQFIERLIAFDLEHLGRGVIDFISFSLFFVC